MRELLKKGAPVKGGAAEKPIGGKKTAKTNAPNNKK